MKELIRRAANAGVVSLFMLFGATVSSSAAGYAVHVNCNVSPCMLGLAAQGYAGPGTARKAEGWRQLSQTYYKSIDAKRTLCRWHYGKPGYSSPQVVRNEVPCAALCNGNRTCK